MIPFKVFPTDINKMPLFKGWQAAASKDPAQLELWTKLYGQRLAYWGIPTGPENDLLVLDIDIGLKDGMNGFETIKTLPIPQTMTQATRSGGAHLFFKYPRDGKVYGNKVKFMPGLDVRGQGGYVCFYGAELKPIADPPPWLLTDVVKPQYQHQGPVVKVSPEIANGIIMQSLEAIRQAPAGESNNVLNTEAFKIGQLVASESIPRAYAESVLMDAARLRGKPEYEARATIHSALDGGAKKPITSPFGASEPVAGIEIPPVPVPTRWTPQAFTRYDLLNTSMLRKPQLFQDWSSQDITITTADGGTGKTTLKLFEAIHLALGERFLGFDCKHAGKTLFITGEDTDKKLTAMLGAIIRQMGLFEEGVGNNGKIQTILDSIRIKKDSDLCVVSKDKNGFLIPNQDALRKLHEAIDDFKPQMIVFDPISSFWGPENAVNDMAKAVIKFMSELVERSGACVEMINHMGKQSSSNKDMSQFAGRGGTGLPSNARVSRVMRGVGDDEFLELTGETLNEKHSAIMVNVNKFSDGSPLLNKPFLVVRDRFLFYRKNLTPQKAREAEIALSDNERVFSYIKEQRMLGKYPTAKVVVAHFMFESKGDISGERIKRALHLLEYDGHLGSKIKLIANPDITMSEKVIVVLDANGKEE